MCVYMYTEHASTLVNSHNALALICVSRGLEMRAAIWRRFNINIILVCERVNYESGGGRVAAMFSVHPPYRPRPL